MMENNKDQDRRSGSSQSSRDHGQENQAQNASNPGQQDENSQDGAEWNNYQTRELSDQKYDKKKNRGAGAE